MAAGLADRLFDVSDIVALIEQAEAPHIRQSELCATCHTLLTQALDARGEVDKLLAMILYPGQE